MDWDVSGGQEYTRPCWGDNNYGERPGIQAEEDSATTQPMFPTTMSHSGMNQHSQGTTSTNQEPQGHLGMPGMFHPC